MSQFQFGDAVIGLAASEKNPHKRGFFVRRFHCAARMVNPGWHIEITDGKGDFWICPESNVVRDADHLADRAELVEIIRELVARFPPPRTKGQLNAIQRGKKVLEGA